MYTVVQFSGARRGCQGSTANVVPVHSTSQVPTCLCADTDARRERSRNRGKFQSFIRSCYLILLTVIKHRSKLRQDVKKRTPLCGCQTAGFVDNTGGAYGSAGDPVRERDM